MFLVRLQITNLLFLLKSALFLHICRCHFLITKPHSFVCALHRPRMLSRTGENAKCRRLSCTKFFFLCYHTCLRAILRSGFFAARITFNKSWKTSAWSKLSASSTPLSNLRARDKNLLDAVTFCVPPINLSSLNCFLCLISADKRLTCPFSFLVIGRGDFRRTASKSTQRAIIMKLISALATVAP